MTLVKWKPNRSIFNVFDEVEQMMQQSTGYSLTNDKTSSSYSPLMNVSETDDDYLCTLDIPGVEKKDVEVSLDNGILTVSGERKTSDMSESNKGIWHEVSYGAFKRSFELTSDVIENKIKAKFSNGVLNISIPKAEEVKPSVKRIAVN